MKLVALESIEFQMHFPFEIDFSHGQDIMLLHFKRFYPDSSGSRFPWGVEMVDIGKNGQIRPVLPEWKITSHNCVED